MGSEKKVMGLRSLSTEELHSVCYHESAWHSDSQSCHDKCLQDKLDMQELRCGHFMHSHCFAQYTRYNYSCPVCSKSMGDMSIYFGMLDSIVAKDLADLPPAYRSRQQVCLPDIPV